MVGSLYIALALSNGLVSKSKPTVIILPLLLIVPLDLIVLMLLPKMVFCSPVDGDLSSVELSKT